MKIVLTSWTPGKSLRVGGTLRVLWFTLRTTLSYWRVKLIVQMHHSLPPSVSGPGFYTEKLLKEYLMNVI